MDAEPRPANAPGTGHPGTGPYKTGMLDVGDGNLVYREICGNPAGRPAVVLHGGPGVGCGPRHRELFDLDRYPERT